MRKRSVSLRPSAALVIGAAGMLIGASTATDEALTRTQDKNKKPSISLKGTPTTGFSPLRVVFTAELKGGADDYEEFYCATAEWDWGDDTRSETRVDCDPYEPGKSEIKRRFSTDHTFRNSMSDMARPDAAPMQYRVRFNLKQKNKTVGSASTTVEVRQGVGLASILLPPGTAR
jgi:hypothetical protein